MIEKSQEIIEMKTKDGMAFTVSFSNDPPDYQRLDEIEGYCEKILSDLLHYSQGTINTAENRRLEEEIEKLKGEKKWQKKKWTKTFNQAKS